MPYRPLAKSTADDTITYGHTVKADLHTAKQLDDRRIFSAANVLLLSRRAWTPTNAVSGAQATCAAAHAAASMIFVPAALVQVESENASSKRNYTRAGRDTYLAELRTC